MGLMDYLPRGNWGLSPSNLRLPSLPRLYEPDSPIDVGANKIRNAVDTYGPSALRAGAGALAVEGFARPGGLTSAALTGAGQFGRFLTRAPQRPLGDEARSMGMIEGPVDGARADDGHATDNPAVMNARNSPSPVDGASDAFTPLFSDAEYEGMRGANAAAHYKPATRALRLPGGKFLFTNRDELGGEQVDVHDAGREIRGMDATPSNTRMAMAPRVDPTSATMSALVRSSIRSSQGERAPGLNVGSAMPFRAPGRMVEGERPDTRGGGVTMAEGGTEPMRLALRLQDALGALSLADTQQQQKVAEMDPAEAALLGNPQVQSGSWALNTLQPQIEAAQKRAQEAAAQARASIQDPKQLAQTLRSIQDERDQAVREALATLTVLLGLRPQTI